jgi:hypothetical protein
MLDDLVHLFSGRMGYWNGKYFHWRMCRVSHVKRLTAVSRAVTSVIITSGRLLHLYTKGVGLPRMA